MSLPLCLSCGVRKHCFANGTGKIGLRQLDRAAERRFSLKRGGSLFRIGDPFVSLFAIRSGGLKSCMRNEAGREQVVGFHLPGDIVGVGGIGPRVYIFNLTALEPSELCEIRFDKLEELASHVPRIRRNVARVLGQYLGRGFGVRTLLARARAEVKLAGFLLDFSRRLAARDCDPASFELPMTRADIANHLGLSTATVAKGFALLCKRKIAKARGRTIRLTNIGALEALAATYP